MPRALIPNSTQIPDVILDQWMAEMSGAEFKVLLYIARRTYGFGKDKDTISLTQLAQGITKRDGTTLDRGTGISRMSVARALKVLEERGIILRKRNLNDKTQEYEENTYSINLDWEPPTQEGHGGSSGPSNPARRMAGKGVVTKCDHLVSEGDRGWYQNVTRVVTKVDIQETDQQETVQETAANGAAAVLVEELVSRGVSRTTATRYAEEKPDVCRRCLSYLPFAKVRTTTGAWLANAIRDEYGPPQGYLDAKRLEERKAETQKVTEAENARKGRQETRRREKEAQLRETLGRLEEEQGNAFAAFTEYVNQEREKAARIAANLTPERKNEHLASFGTPERRLQLFEEWLNSQEQKPSNPASVREWPGGETGSVTSTTLSVSPG